MLLVLAAAGVAAARPPSPAAVAVPVFKPAPGRSLCRGADGYARDFEGRRTFFWRPEWLRARKKKLAVDPAARAAFKRAADDALAEPPLSVRDKTATPASGDKGDYYSIGPYWWPDPTKSGGLPYVRRDGERNPQVNDDTFDSSRRGRFADRVGRLALASYYLDDPRYARRAAELIRVWFLDPRTRMNPNLNFGQAVPGVTAGRAEGLIEMPALGEVIDAIGLIEPSGTLTPREIGQLRDWFRRFTTWMIESPIGKDEQSRTNNHALFYDYMLTHFSLFAGAPDVAIRVARNFPGRLIAQMDGQGALPEEIARTRSWSYSVFALRGAVWMATVGECAGFDIWAAKTADGRGLGKALEFLLPYQSRAQRWPYPDILLDDKAKPAEAAEIGAALFRVAAWGMNRTDVDRAAGSPAKDEDWLAPLQAQ